MLPGMEEPEPRPTVRDRLLAPLRRIWESEDPFDDFALVHMASAAGDALVALALANSIFFSLPVGQAKTRVALYLGLTMAPLAFSAPLLVPLLDRGGFRRAIALVAAVGRAAAAVFAASHLDSLLLFPAAFGLLVLSRAHALNKNGLTAAYARDHLVAANARLGRWAAVGVLIVLLPGFLLFKLGGSEAVLFLAAIAYLLGATFSLFLRQPPEKPRPRVLLGARGRVAELAMAAAGTVGLRAAQGFLLFLLAFALREAPDRTSWLGVLMAAAVAGTFLGDLVAPRLPPVREEHLLLFALAAAGVAGFFAFLAFSLPVLAVFSGLVGISTRLGQLAFQSLMQRSAPGGAHGRVFVRYEVVFQLGWVAGAFLPAMLPIPFRAGVLALAIFYLGIAFLALFRPLLRERQPAG